MFKFAYLLLRQRLLEIQGIPAVFWYNAQTDPDTDEPVVYCPAVYIEFLPVELRTLPDKVQTGALAFRVHLFQEYLGQEDQAIEHMVLADAIFAALQGHEAWLSDLPEYEDLAGTAADRLVFNQLSRTQLIPDHQQTNTIITVQEFQGLAVDLSARPSLSSVDADAAIIRPVSI